MCPSSPKRYFFLQAGFSKLEIIGWHNHFFGMKWPASMMLASGSQLSETNMYNDANERVLATKAIISFPNVNELDNRGNEH